MSRLAVLVLASLVSRFGASALSASLSQCTLTEGHDCVGNDIINYNASSSQDCCDICSRTQYCGAFSYAPKYVRPCFLKTSCSEKKASTGITAGENSVPMAGKCSITQKQGCSGEDLGTSTMSSADGCCAACDSTAGCSAFVYRWGKCYLKAGCSHPSSCSDCISGSLPDKVEHWTHQASTDYDGGDIETKKNVADANECSDWCNANGVCRVAVYIDGKCFLKDETAYKPKANTGCTAVFRSSNPPSEPAPPKAVTQLSWDEAYAKADQMLGLMSDSEKYSLMRGGKSVFVGSTEPVTRLGIPALLMQDAAAGFRTTPADGTSTAWPSLLSIAATWDRDLMLQFATALGTEFAMKGANVILGPSINVHRVARGGRNFEYLSGEDPYLGAQLTDPYVRGVQSMGVMAVMKHFVFNTQETERGSVNMMVDDKTAWELYYPPFQAAVDAGVSATMCSYNKEDGKYSCSNGGRLDKDLKGAMGFKGFVQSDWGATHATSVEQGLDQDMPGGAADYFSDKNLGSVDGHALYDSTKRVLAAMYRLDAFNQTKCRPPACDNFFKRNVTSDGHAKLARTVATESIVLLKNDGDVLPLSKETVKTIAVVGAASVAQQYVPGTWNRGDYYAGGGSGHVVGSYVVTPFDGIRQRAALEGIKVISSGSDDVNSAVNAAKQADITIVVVATTSGEGSDRNHLDLDNARNLIPPVAKAAKKTVVITQMPGTSLMTWRNSVAAIATMFLGGQETGNAWASVLFGDHAPTGRLPVMIPESEDDTIMPGSGTVTCSEGMATSYRNQHFKAAFPFGHGLTYTKFQYGKPRAVGCSKNLCISVDVQNVGQVAAKEVAQLYLEFPTEAGYPTSLLKGFVKSSVIKPGEASKVTFVLLPRDVSYYDNGKWIKVQQVVAHIGASSSDIRVNLTTSTDASEVDVIV